MSERSERASERGPAQRRIAALILPELLLELAALGAPHERDAGTLRARAGVAESPPFAVFSSDEAHATGAASPSPEKTRLEAVSPGAWRYGVRPGQTLIEARARLARLELRAVSTQQITEALGRVAELSLAFGAPAALGGRDTVWLDVSGSASLFGSEEALAEQLVAAASALGHRVRLAIASGPLVARAFARFGAGQSDVRVLVPSEETQARLGALPLEALPLDEDQVRWLGRVGIRRVSELSALPRASVVARLGASAPRILELAAGHDPTPLVAYVPPERLSESMSCPEGLTSQTPLLFILKRLSACLSARLAGRGLAARELELRLEHDRAMARLAGKPPRQTLAFALALPLWRESELLRVLRARLDTVELAAPLVSVELVAPTLSARPERQLDLARGAARLGSRSDQGPECLPVLLAELAADVGAGRVGRLEVSDSFRPEAQSRLVPCHGDGAALFTSGRESASGRSARLAADGEARAPGAARWLSEALGLLRQPTRLIEPPLELALLSPGVSLELGGQVCVLERATFEMRLERVEWWTPAPVSRDYVRLWLRGASGAFEALAYSERGTGRHFLQALYD